MALPGLPHPHLPRPIFLPTKTLQVLLQGQPQPRAGLCQLWISEVLDEFSCSIPHHAVPDLCCQMSATIITRTLVPNFT